MNNIIRSIIIITALLLIQGCKKDMNYEPQDFFNGRQLEIAEAIFDGNENELQQKLPLLSKEELNAPAKEKMTLLFWAITNTTGDNATPKRAHMITSLIKSGADPLQPQPNMPGSPAEFAMKSDNAIWIKAMLDGGLSPDARDKLNNKPIIFQSIWAKNTETLETILDYGADINIRNSLGDTVLIDALDAHSYDHVILLLKRGADSSIRGSSGWTMGNQLQRYLNRDIGDPEDRKKLEEIKALLIRDGGTWPPVSVEK
ncbi:hypothetical protein B5M10_14230 [Pluralibacter gergoviae]|uniref:ankyrin repeat domain-containing protein n=1 Tax=Pluralibacter gergoviae TaxID=61647 RepID=UPI00032A00A9|nr:ankyrin repeat domain-containing protein [Pluralibacter gergoviae]AIR02484.1 hypothetical protein LG71_22440 [Pluralibacter gergoviae]ELG9928054.1 ankyrin repeat domain-containing protein [Pluralibacter gergoviae]ELK5592445.1 ankyrin repeat domain-containing protein [Pluralibacter gergoviae]ELO7481921.1 ankyrin repeat domain-containing protein [Pluralibacter gergoviae]ELW9443809.1 ankyrin repeat domain-containing protein [Pluralibacter gergoviae]